VAYTKRDGGSLALTIDTAVSYCEQNDKERTVCS